MCRFIELDGRRCQLVTRTTAGYCELHASVVSARPSRMGGGSVTALLATVLRVNFLLYFFDFGG